MKKRFTEQQIIGFLKEAEAGMPVKELCRKHGFSDASFYTWRAKFGGMEVSEARRLKGRRGGECPTEETSWPKQCSIWKR
ncbi:transposase family protein [Burkholderia mallei]|nr:transposase family protein [Burkholderia mallei]